MNYISVKEASKKWGISERRVRILCSENRIDGVTKSSWAWNIPSSTPKPSDGRVIRHIKNVDLRVNALNFNTLVEGCENFNKIVDSTKLYKDYFDDSVNRFLLMALTDEQIQPSDIIKVLNKEYVETLNYDKQLLILNAKSIIIDFYKQTGFGPILPRESKNNPFFSDKRFKEINDALYKGFDDYHISKYRDAKIVNPSSFDEKLYNVSMQIETLILQYESDWNILNALVKASFMFSQLLRIQPFEKHNFLFASLIFAGILLDADYPLAIIPYDLVDELKANLSLTLKRGNYTNIIRMFESSLLVELDKLIALAK